MDYGEKFLKFRAKYKLTQSQLAEILDVALNTVHRAECNKHQPSKRNAIIYETKMKEWEEKQNGKQSNN